MLVPPTFLWAGPAVTFRACEAEWDSAGAQGSPAYVLVVDIMGLSMLCSFNHGQSSGHIGCFASSGWLLKWLAGLKWPNQY